MLSTLCDPLMIHHAKDLDFKWEEGDLRGRAPVETNKMKKLKTNGVYFTSLSAIIKITFSFYFTSYECYVALTHCSR